MVKADEIKVKIHYAYTPTRNYTKIDEQARHLIFLIRMINDYAVDGFNHLKNNKDPSHIYELFFDAAAAFEIYVEENIGIKILLSEKQIFESAKKESLGIIDKRWYDKMYVPSQLGMIVIN